MNKRPEKCTKKTYRENTQKKHAWITRWIMCKDKTQGKLSGIMCRDNVQREHTEKTRMDNVQGKCAWKSRRITGTKNLRGYKFQNDTVQ